MATGIQEIFMKVLASRKTAASNRSRARTAMPLLKVAPTANPRITRRRGLISANARSDSVVERMGEKTAVDYTYAARG